MRNDFPIAVAFVICFLCSTAGAQENGGAGLTLAYPVSVGIVWPVSKTLALRPELTGAVRASEATLTSATGNTTPNGSSDSRSLYVRQWDALRAYLVPRFAYTRSTTRAGATDDVVSEYAVTGWFGLKCVLSRRFAIFAELGAGYNRQKGSSTIAAGVIDTTTNTVSPRSGIGAIVRF
jgi:hypothetical protein